MKHEPASDLTVPGTASGPGRGTPDAPAPLDPRVSQVIRSSAARLIRFEDEFIRQLQSDIKVLIPELAGEGWAFCERMVRYLLWVATTDQPPRAVAEALRWVGARNWLEGFPEGRYVDVAHALVRAVHNVSRDSWTASMGSAWVSYFLWTEPYLLTGAQQAAAQQAAARRAAEQQAAARLEAARQAAARAQALSQDPDRNRSAVGDVDLEAVSDLLDDEDEEEAVGYGQIMLSMTPNRRRERQ